MSRRLCQFACLCALAMLAGCRLFGRTLGADGGDQVGDGNEQKNLVNDTSVFWALVFCAIMFGLILGMVTLTQAYYSYKRYKLHECGQRTERMGTTNDGTTGDT